MEGEKPYQPEVTLEPKEEEEIDTIVDVSLSDKAEADLTPEQQQKEDKELFSQQIEKVQSSYELYPEVIEKILEKKIDINEPGTPFTVVDSFDIDAFRKQRENTKNDIERRKKTYKEFKDDKVKHSFYLSNNYPLLQFKKDVLYSTYLYFGFKEESKTHGDQGIKSYGLDTLGDIFNEPISKEEFDEKYEIAVKLQRAEIDAKIRLEYKEYLQNLEDKINLPTKERYIEKYISNALSSTSRRTDLLRPQYYLDNVDSLYEQYLEFGNPEEGYDERLYSGKDRSLVRTLALLGIYKEDKNFKDEDDRARFLRVDSETLDKEAFTVKYEQALKEQAERLKEAAIRAYESEVRENDESQVIHKSLDKMRKIFKNGILGGRRWNKQVGASMEPSEWAKDMRQKRQERHVFYNVVGGFHNELHYHIDDRYGSSAKIKDSFFFHDRSPAVAIVLDNKNLQGSLDDPNLEKGIKYSTHNNAWRPDSEYGYAGRARVAPRNFKGIVITCYDTEKETKTIWGKEEVVEKKVLSNDESKWDRAAQAMAQTMLEVYKDDPEKCVPIYDPNGNMLWPKKILAEEMSQEKNKTE